MSRCAMIIHSSINYKRRSDLESIHDCTIWIEVKESHNKAFLIMAGYRQWSLPEELNIIDSKKPYKQFLRWQSILNNW